jgi:putative transcriptional regulator
MELEKNDFLLGKLLIAMPGMLDPRFERSVILMCSHSAEGAMGLIVNKPVSGLVFSELLLRYDLSLEAGAPEVPIVFGGPVELGRGFILHSADYTGEQATVPVTSKISLTASIEILHAIAAGRGPRRSLLALGYAGWGEGQIEREILENAWIHCDADPDLIFGTPYDAMWKKAIATLGVDISGFAGTAGRA